MPKKKVACALVLLTLIALILLPGPACSGTYEYIWKSGSLVPKGVGYATQINQIFVPGLLEATDGKLMLKTYFGGIMGDDEDVLKKVQAGQLEAAGSGAQLAFMVCPDLGVTSLPFLFNNYDEVDYIRKAMYPAFDEITQSGGLKLLLWLDQGFDQIYSVDKPIASLESFENMKFLTWCGDIEVSFIETMGASAVPVDVPEFNASIRKGLAEAYIGPPIWGVSTQMYAVLRYINTTNVRYSPAVFVVSMEAWNALPAEYQKRISAQRESWQTPFIEGSRADNKKCLEAMLKYGVQKVETPPEVLEALKKKSRPLYDKMADRVYSRKILTQTERLLEEYRASHAGG
ncbi:TRAP-type C4-dicarboxylate transport system, substrate-binding protein [Desulfatibacillum alkenivorans DSM 16219]|jgi:TRAP-type C4-dicarboxylate transport system substrate-binding protein|uniref:TRAP-type C4-dicarboxylate transport system, substrate-binding protein n=1 Tax=Desulfatibacillum alkenivorans DSM 16219 TaxID=1121393 RepID=A0A1M6F7K3_9BACT|nr:TRAP transporter substrate-binding protein DctP [Desulfatibacillum alkenivorans]SHI93632.1 TRAP-type C4-dicarboxylate transport system, substrate-binding protein [Desulfatibacillum alkenivorans DSM 16219]